MGFRAAGFLGFVLLLSGGHLCFAAQNWFISGTNETLDQTPRERVTTSLQQAMDLSPFTFRLKTYQLRNPAAPPDKQNLPQSGEEQEQTSQSLQEAESTPPSELPEDEKASPAPEVVLFQGPKLNLSRPDPGRKASKVA